MSEEQILVKSVQIAGERGEPPTSGQVQVLFWSKKERTLRALKFGGMCWGAAVISVIFPLVHFVLVPGFLLAGPIVVYLVMRQESVIVGGEGTCPRCKAALPIARTSYRFPFSDLCTQCQSSVKVELSS